MAMSEENKESILKMWQDGVTSNQIADSLGLTRNAVMGFIHRQKAKGQELRGHQPRKPPMPVKKPARIISFFEKKIPAKDKRNIELHELTPTSCRFIVTGDGEPVRYCGDKITYRSYCALHTTMCYRPAVPAKRVSKMRRG